MLLRKGFVDMDRIIFGDNQFFGINHMSEDKAQLQAERFGDLSEIIKVIDIAYECGIHSFMFNTHDRVADICDHFRSRPSQYSDLRLYPSMPYAHKYADAVAQKGIFKALNDFVFANSSMSQATNMLYRGGKLVFTRDMMELMRLLVDAEMKMFRGLNVRVVFLQNIVTDLLLGMGVKECFIEFAEYIRTKYNAEVGFNTMNMPALVDFLLDCGFENPIVCSSINKIGYLMCPDRETYEYAIENKPFRPMAMSIMASGAIPPKEAIEYIVRQRNIRSIVFGASSKRNIEETKGLIDELWGMNS